MLVHRDVKPFLTPHCGPFLLCAAVAWLTRSGRSRGSLQWPFGSGCGYPPWRNCRRLSLKLQALEQASDSGQPVQMKRTSLDPTGMLATGAVWYRSARHSKSIWPNHRVRNTAALLSSSAEP